MRSLFVNKKGDKSDAINVVSTPIFSGSMTKKVKQGERTGVVSSHPALIVKKHCHLTNVPAWREIVGKQTNYLQ